MIFYLISSLIPTHQKDRSTSHNVVICVERSR